jgi:hypothetical protein
MTQIDAIDPISIGDVAILKVVLVTVITLILKP